MVVVLEVGCCRGTKVGEGKKEESGKEKRRKEVGMIEKEKKKHSYKCQQKVGSNSKYNSKE